MDGRITPGCWVSTCWGEAVVTSVTEESVFYRYPATRMDGTSIWVANGDLLREVTFLREGDETTLPVLDLRGPYGEGDLPRDEDCYWDWED